MRTIAFTECYSPGENVFRAIELASGDVSDVAVSRERFQELLWDRNLVWSVVGSRAPFVQVFVKCRPVLVHPRAIDLDVIELYYPGEFEELHL